MTTNEIDCKNLAKNAYQKYWHTVCTKSKTKKIEQLKKSLIGRFPLNYKFLLNESAINLKVYKDMFGLKSSITIGNSNIYTLL